MFKDTVFLENNSLNVCLRKVSSTSVLFFSQRISLECLFNPVKSAVVKRYLISHRSTLYMIVEIFVTLERMFFIVKEFLMLDEITKSSTAVPQEDKDASIEIQDLICYWDKVGNCFMLHFT